MIRTAIYQLIDTPTDNQGNTNMESYIALLICSIVASLSGDFTANRRAAQAYFGALLQLRVFGVD